MELYDSRRQQNKLLTDVARTIKKQQRNHNQSIFGKSTNSIDRGLNYKLSDREGGAELGEWWTMISIEVFYGVIDAWIKFSWLNDYDEENY